MKHYLLSLSLISLAFAVVPRLSANSVTLYASPYTYEGGAEVTAVTSPSFLGNYSSAAIEPSAGGAGFETFCVEQTVTAAPATLYSYTLGQTTSQGQVLSVGAAYLYWLFATGDLNGGSTPSYNYANAGGTRIDDSESMQTAIWALMGEPDYFGQDVLTDPYYQFALTTFGPGAFNPNNGSYPVDVMQLWDYNDIGNPSPNGYQAQLVLTGVPDGGSSVLMLGCAFSILGLAGWRAGKKSR